MKKNIKSKSIITNLFLLVIITVMLGCKKDPIDWYRPIGEPMSSFVKFVNTLPGSRMEFYAYSAKISRAEGIRYGDTAVPYAKAPYGGTIIYGTNFNNTSNRVSATTSAVSPQMNAQGLVANYYQTMFTCKTTDSTAAETMILLRDELSTPASGKAHIRFVHLGQRGTTTIRNLDVFTSGIGNIFSNMRYQVPSNAVRIIPVNTASPGTTGLNTPGLGPFTSGPFTPIDAGSYTMDIKTAGTEDILTSKTVNLENGKIYTLYTVGIINGATPFELKVLPHVK